MLARIAELGELSRQSDVGERRLQDLPAEAFFLHMNPGAESGIEGPELLLTELLAHGEATRTGAQPASS